MAFMRDELLFFPAFFSHFEDSQGAPNVGWTVGWDKALKVKSSLRMMLLWMSLRTLSKNLVCALTAEPIRGVH